MPSITDLLNALSDGAYNQNKPTLANTKDTWARMKDKNFPELGLEGSELESFLAEWCAENPYNNIK